MIAADRGIDSTGTWTSDLEGITEKYRLAIHSEPKSFLGPVIASL
jgi:hypothetical protein